MLARENSPRGCEPHTVALIVTKETTVAALKLQIEAACTCAPGAQRLSSQGTELPDDVTLGSRGIGPWDELQLEWKERAEQRSAEDGAEVERTRGAAKLHSMEQSRMMTFGRGLVILGAGRVYW